MADQQLAVSPQRQGIIAKFGEQYDMEPGKVMNIVANTVFKGSDKEPPLVPEEIAAALIVCNAYNLNPFTKEIYAFRSKGKLLIVVGIDGWATIVNRQPQFNGIEFEEHFDDRGNIRAVTCRMHRKDRALPTVVTEYTHECRRDTIPWNTMPIRMTRNRAFVQCARIAFSVSGIIDNDEAQTIEGSPEFVTGETKAIIDQSSSKMDAVKAVIKKRAQAGNGKEQAQQSAELADLMQTETVDPKKSECPECKASFGIHLVTCSQFSCKECGARGPAEDHRGGCPTLKKEAAAQPQGEAQPQTAELW
jgi:phage recombination protein Bet